MTKIENKTFAIINKNTDEVLDRITLAVDSEESAKSFTEDALDDFKNNLAIIPEEFESKTL